MYRIKKNRGSRSKVLPIANFIKAVRLSHLYGPPFYQVINSVKDYKKVSPIYIIHALIYYNI